MDFQVLIGKRERKRERKREGKRNGKREGKREGKKGREKGRGNHLYCSERRGRGSDPATKL